MFEFKSFNPFEGNEERRKKAEERHQAILDGRLPEYEKKEAEKNAAREKSANRPMTPEDIKMRNEKIREGAPEAQYLAAAARRKLMTGDKRDVKEIAGEMMREANERSEEAA